MLRKIKNFIIDLFFPIICINCGKEGKWLCNDCKEKIKIIRSSFCPRCNVLTKMNRFCERCSRKSSLEGVFILGYYNDPILKKAIWEFKYNFIKDISEILSKILANYLIRRTTLENSIFVAVPLDKDREKWRGFNQSEILASKIAKILKIPFYNNILIKVKKTKTQTDLTKKERFENVSGAFLVKNFLSNKRKRVFLVDDVYTTGSTLEECAKELKKAGAKEVWGVVLAKD